MVTDQRVWREYAQPSQLQFLASLASFADNSGRNAVGSAALTPANAGRSRNALAYAGAAAGHDASAAVAMAWHAFANGGAAFTIRGPPYDHPGHGEVGYQAKS